MRWTIHVSFLNGDSVAVSIDPDARVEDLRLEAQRKIKKQVAGLMRFEFSIFQSHKSAHPNSMGFWFQMFRPGLSNFLLYCVLFCCLVPEGLVFAGAKLQVSSNLQLAGLKDGADVTGVLDVNDITVKAHKFGWGFGAIINGSLKIWGYEPYFELSQEQRKKTETDVLELFFTETAVAALMADGGVVTCGDQNGGGDSQLVKDQLVDIASISGTSQAFAALKTDGTILCWGNPDSGGDCTSVQTSLHGIRQVFPCQNAFAAVTETGRVITWGQQDEGGDSTEVQSQLIGVKHIVSSAHAFAAILRDGSVVSWGSHDAGGNSISVREKLTKVKAVYASKYAFAAVTEDGGVVTWGPSEHGGLDVDTEGKNEKSKLVL